MRYFRYSVLVILVLVSVSTNAFGQNDWHTYPDRTLAELEKDHTRDTTRKPDMIISADPFPSKTAVIYGGKHRPVNERTTEFVKLWAQSRNLSPETHTKLTEEYLFKENDREYWLPVLNKLAPFIEQELKPGDEVRIYFFFLGGYNPKTLQDKRNDGKKIEGLQDRIEFIFVLEEFQKRKPPEPATKDQPLSAAIDPSFKIPAGSEWAADVRYVKSRSLLEWMGQTRATGPKRRLLIAEWGKTIGLTEEYQETFAREALFREGDKEYWIPVLRNVLMDMERQLVKGDKVLVSTMLLGGIRQSDGIEWVSLAGVFSKPPAK